MNLKPNCFEKTEVRWGIFSFFSSTNVETKNVCPIAGNVLRVYVRWRLEALHLVIPQNLNRRTNVE